jgi:hypothetical protein
MEAPEDDGRSAVEPGEASALRFDQRFLLFSGGTVVATPTTKIQVIKKLTALPM